MDRTQLIELLSGSPSLPIKLKDGTFGLLIHCWSDSVGVQVPGEEDLRKLPLVVIAHEGNGALAEVESLLCAACERVDSPQVADGDWFEVQCRISRPGRPLHQEVKATVCSPECGAQWLEQALHGYVPRTYR